MEDFVPRILIADEHEPVRLGLHALLACDEHWQVCGEASTFDQMMQVITATHPEVIIIDLNIIAPSPLDSIQQIRARFPATNLLMFTMDESEHMFRTLVGAGVRGYLFKSDPLDMIKAAIDALAAHRPYFSPKISDSLRRCVIERTWRVAHQCKDLSSREREIIQLIAEGCTNKEIAKMLRLSTKTVETHRGSIMRKLGVANVVEVVRYAFRNNLVVP
jgi:DNA-binding NarL/FixJ family response regulator